MADTKIKITAETDQAESSLISLGRHVDGVSGKFSGFAGIAGALGGVLSISAFASIIKGSIDAADELSKLSQKTGTAVEDLAGLKFAADQNGTSLEAVANASKKLSTSMADKPELFAQFGINAKDSTGALIQMADVFAAMPDGVEKTALAVKLMGKSGEEMIPFLNQGSEELARMVEQGKELNPVTTENALAAAQFNDNLDLLMARGITPFIKLANDLLPMLNDTVSAFTELSKSGESFIPIGSVIKSIFETIVVLGANIGYVFKMAGNEIGGMAAQLAALATGDFKGAKAIGEAMRADAAAARAEIDAFSDRILNGSAAKPSAAPATAVAQDGSAGRSLLGALGGDDKESKNAAKEQERIDADIARQQAKYDKLHEMALMYDAKDQDRITWKLAFDLGALDEEKKAAEAKHAWNDELEVSYQQARVDREAMAQAELKAMRDKELLDKQQKDALEIQFMRASFQFKKSMRIADLGNALGLLALATEGMASHSRRAFEINKAASIASIMVKAPKIITDAFDSGQQEWGSYWGGVAYAAAAAVAIGAQLSAAQSATFGGGGSVAPAYGGTAGMPASSAADQAGGSAALPSQGTEAAPKANSTIHLHGSFFDAKTVRDLATLIAEAKADGVNFDVVTD
ncbi:MAG TPA: hypothetical protein DCK83_00445 [Gallionellaceae bacterium]|nr:hypothetical protein [Gallionellaceae bacterium]